MGAMYQIKLRFSFRFKFFRQNISLLDYYFPHPACPPRGGWTVVDDRIVPGIVRSPGKSPKMMIPYEEYGKWFSATPRHPEMRFGRNMLGFTLGTEAGKEKEVMMESSTWVLDKFARVRYENEQFLWTGPGKKHQFSSVRHPLPHDVRQEDWVVMVVAVKVGDVAGKMNLDMEELTEVDFLDAEHPLMGSRFLVF